jgi:precorrin-6A/cobalt-precorrin-6A reductase
LTIGTQELAAFSEVRDVWFLVRLIDPPRDTPPIAGHEIILGRGPFTLAEERRIIEHHAIDVLVTKASGGAATETKLIAARAAGLPVVMVRRPPPPPGPLVSSVEAALDWVTARRR